MLKIRKIPFIAHRKKSVAQASPPVIGPVMIDADFDSGKLIMEFDRDVSLDHFVPSAITVNDPDSGSKYVGSGGDVAAGSIVQVFMDISGPSSGSQKWMNATGANGIVAVDDGTEWAGVNELALPYP